MSSEELHSVESLSDWYLKEQLDFDKRLIRYRYETIKPKLVGKRCLELGPAEGEMTQFLIQDFQELTVVEGSSELLAKIPDYDNVKKFMGCLRNSNQSKHLTRLFSSMFWNMSKILLHC
jgi:16S rRNA A1518/A1519 N6-dimethyltransferase RsmA/KsgA/DIM1 with predicted DNA glycosylase/AP lyase activity